MNTLIPRTHVPRRAAPILLALFALASVCCPVGAATSTTTAVTSSAQPSIYGNSVQFTATVIGSGGTPTGTVQFKTNGVNFNPPVALNASTQATSLAVATLPAGNHTVTAEYGGDANFLSSTGTLAGGQQVNKRLLTVYATGVDRVYDRTTNATVSLFALPLSGDEVTLTNDTAFFADANANSSVLVTVFGVAISGGASAGNYSVAETTIYTTANITTKTVTPTVTFINKVYDGTTNATVLGRSLAGVISPDEVSLWATNTPYFQRPYVLNNRPVTITNLSLIGASAGNYVLSTTTFTGSANITKASLTLTNNGDVSKLYDGRTTNASLGLTLVGLFNDDPITITNYSANFTSKTVGLNKTLIATNLAFSPAPTNSNPAASWATNYTFPNGTNFVGNITNRVLNVTATGGNKTYNGDATAAVTLNTDKVSTDTVTVSAASATFSDKYIGTNKQVTVSGIAIGGADAGNYTLATNQLFILANIASKPLTPDVTVADKLYDGTTAATILGRSFAVSAFPIPGDDVSLGASGVANFDNQFVGTNKLVTITGLSLAGTMRTNYTLTTTTATDTANITGKPLTVIATATNKVYDATTTAGVRLQIVETIDPPATLTYTNATFDTANIGTNKIVTVSGIAITGDGTNYYTLVNTTATTNANITTRPLIVTATGVNKEYDRTTNATVVLSSDAPTNDVPPRLELVYTNASFRTANVELNKPVDVTGISIRGSNAGNYNLANTNATTTADITNRRITITADPKSKCFGVTADPALTYQITTGSLLSGDSFTGTLTRDPGDAVGSYAITQGTVALASNYYTLTYVGATLTVKPLPVCAIAGPDIMPQNSVRSFTNEAGLNAYSWSITGNGAIAGSANQRVVVVTAGATCDQSFILTCTVTSDGCSSTCSKTVTVPDTTPPALATLADAIQECGSTNALPTPSALDNCAGTNVVLTVANSAPVEVTEDDMAGWAFYTQNTATSEFVDGPAGSPLPTGSAHLETVEGYAAAQMDTANHDGTSLADLTELNYRTFRTAGGFDNNIYITLTVDNGVDAVPDYLTFEPKYQNGSNPALPVQGAVTNGGWQRWNALAGGWYSDLHNAVASPGAPGGGNAGVQSLARYLAVYPDTVIISASSGFGGILLGAGNFFDTWENFDGNVDDFIVGVSGTSVAYNFEATSGLNGPGTMDQALTLRTWTATDPSGNKRSSSQTIIVKDLTPPTLVGMPANTTNECSAIPPRANVTATDACNTNVLTFGETSTQNTNTALLGHYSYTITRTWTATDAFGNRTNASQVITVRDTTKPVLSGQGGLTTINCGEPIVFTPPSATDHCTPSAEVFIGATDSPAAGSCPGTFSVTRSWTAMDVSGNVSDTVTQTITVVDVTPPTLVGAPPSTTVQCSAVPPAATVTPVDACDSNPSLTFNQTSTQGTNVAEAAYYNYTITRTWRSMDTCSNIATAVQVITVQDTTKPVLAGQGVTLTNNCPMNPTNLVFTAPTATDNCAPTNLLVITSSDSTTSGPCTGTYAVTRTWTAKDVMNNSSVPVSQTIWVVDVTKPVITCPADMTVACEGTNGTRVTFSVAATDTCDAAPITTSTPASGSLFQVGDTWVTNTAQDACGNVSVPCAFKVTVTDVSAPILAIEDKSIQCGASTSPTNTGYPTLIDGCGATTVLDANYQDGVAVEVTATAAQGWTFLTGGSGAGALVSGPAVPPVPVGSVRLTLTNSGFAAIQGANWNGQLLAHLTELRYSTYRVARASDESVVLVLYVDTDNDGLYDDILYFEPRYQNGVNGTPNQGAVADTLWQEWDALAGAWWSTFHPTIASPGPGARSLANYVVQFPGARIVNPPGQGGVRLQAGTSTGNWQNFNGNVDRFIIGVDRSSLAYDFELAAGLNCGAPSYAKQIIIRTWSAQDTSGNVSSHSQIITVQDMTAPFVTNVAAILVVTNEGCGTGVFFDLPYAPSPTNITLAQLQAQGFDASDACGAITITYQDRVTAGCPLLITRTFTATDACGNSASMPEKKIYVVDTTAPVVAIPSPRTIEGCSTAAITNAFGTNLFYSESIRTISQADFTAAGGTANDSCTVASITYQDSQSSSCPIVVTRTFIVKDQCNNTTTTNQTINVRDSTAPTVTAPPNMDFVGCSTAAITGLAYSETPVGITQGQFTTAGGTNYDACGVDSITYQDSKASACPIVVTRTFTVKDICQNATTNTQTIRVIDTVAPIMGVAGAIATHYPNQAAAETAAKTASSATDNCSTGTNLTLVAATSLSNCTATITVTARDACGNVSTNAPAVYTTRIDGTAPGITLPSNIITNTAPGLCQQTVDPGTATATDACTAESAITVNGTRRDGSLKTDPYPKGTNYIDWVATDSSGNSATNTQTIIVIDLEAPIFPTVSTTAVSGWRADGNANDFVGTNNGTLVGGVTFASGQVGQAFSLDGTNQYVRTLAGGMNFQAGDFSVAGWVKTTSTNQWNTVFNFPGNESATVYIATNSGALRFQGTVNNSASSAAGFNDGRWHHLAVVRQSGAISFFKDGAPAGSGGADATLINPTMFRMGWDGAAGHNFPGQIDEVTVFGRALTADEVARLINDNGCPADIAVNNDPGQCGAIVNYTAPVGTDNCPLATNAVLVSGLRSGALFPVGTTVNTFVVTDGAGNSAQCSFNVTVRDTIPPIFTNCPPATIQVDATNATTCGAVVTYTAPVGTDLCAGATTVQVAGLPSGSNFPAGTTTNVFEVRDAAGNKATCTFNVTVVDKVPPVITSSPGDFTVMTGPGRTTCSAPASWTLPTATDNCGTITWNSTMNSGGLFPVGLTTVTNIARDAAGNTATNRFNVTVVDNTPPVIVGCPADLTVSVIATGTNCEAVASWPVPTVSDNCVVTSFTSTKSPGSVFPVGQTTVTYTARDIAGNTSTCSFVVTVTDSTAPVITGCPANITVTTGAGATNCSKTVTWTPPTATDSCSAVTLTSTKSPGDAFDVGTTTVTYTARDTTGNSNTCSFTVTVINNTGPTFINFPTNVALQCAGDVVPPVVTNVTAIANCGGPVTVTNLGSVTNVVSSCLTTITRTYRATDQFTNSTTQAQIITIADTTPPTMRVTGSIPACSTSQAAAEAAALLAATGSDNCSPASNLTYAVSSVMSNCVLTVSVTATDLCGNVTPLSAAATFTTHIDTEGPVIGAITAAQNSVDVKDKACAVKVIPGDVLITVVASDNCGFAGGAPSIVLTNGSATNTATFVSANAGTFTYKWTVTSATLNGTWNATVTASDSCQSATAGFTVCVDNSEISGLVQLQGFTGTAVNHSRVVTFTATTNNPSTGTNVLKTWTVTVTNVSGDTFSYSLPGVPPNANGVSAKTAWNLRSKLAVTLNGNAQATGVNFTGAKQLRGGDYTEIGQVTGDNQVQNTDYIILGNNWLTTNPAADVNGDGQVASYDYLVLYLNWFTNGDPQ